MIDNSLILHLFLNINHDAVVDDAIDYFKRLALTDNLTILALTKMPVFAPDSMTDSRTYQRPDKHENIKPDIFLFCIYHYQSSLIFPTFTFFPSS